MTEPIELPPGTKYQFDPDRPERYTARAAVNPYDPAREDYYLCQACRENVLVKDQPSHNLAQHSNLFDPALSLMDAMRAANIHGADTLSRVPTEEELDVARRHFNGPKTSAPAEVIDVAMYAVYFVDAGLKVMLATDPTNERVRRLAAMAAAAKAYADGPWLSVRPVG